MCGRTDVDQMLDEMTPQQFVEWQAKDLIEPIGHRGTHEILSLFATMVGHFVGIKDVNQKSFMWWKQEQKPQKESNGHEAAIMMLQAIGAKRG